MRLHLLAVTSIAIGLAVPQAMAEQYVVQINGPLAETSDRLRGNLEIDLIDTFTHEGSDFVVFSAPAEGHLAAYFFTARHTPISLATLGTDWEGAALDGLTLDRRMLFTTPIHCDYCAQ